MDILHRADGSFGTGHTDDLERRLQQHEQGALPGYTQLRRPLRLACSQEFPDREQALTAGHWDQLKAAAKQRF